MPRKRVKSILMYGYAASYATSIILDKKWEELLKRYNYRYLLEQRKLHQTQLGIEIPDISDKDVYIHEIGKGGVLTSLYALSEELKYGLGISMKDIPIIQSTVEIAEYFKLNPYNMLSKAYLILTINAECTKEQLFEKGYSTVLIGALYADTLKAVNDRYEEDGEISYINRPVKDELYKIVTV